MAHFAEIDENGIVKQVLVVPDSEEHRGQEYLADDLALGGTWIQTSYNHTIRKHFAGVGYTYDADADVFVAPQPFASWLLDEEYDWQPPVPRPQGDAPYIWNEKELAWEMPDATV